MYIHDFNKYNSELNIKKKLDHAAVLINILNI
jgi:hypothetical protein